MSEEKKARPNTFKKEAYISKHGGRVKIHIDNLTIELVAEDPSGGPLGWEDGQDPGVIFWESEYISKGPDFFEHGQQELIQAEKLDKKHVERVMEVLNEGLESDNSG